DTISFKNLKNLQFLSEDDYLSIYAHEYGTRIITSSISTNFTEEDNSFADYLEEVMGVKGEKVPLYSRGGCTCSNPNACLTSDVKINENVLIVDKLEFIEESYTDVIYFVQFEHDGEKMNKLIPNDGSHFYIDKSLFELPDSSQFDFNTPALLGRVVKDGEKNIPQRICKFKLVFTEKETLIDHYKVISELFPKENEKLIFDEFAGSVYRNFGKPDVCELKELINQMQ
ncbi:MAG: hypothetical protein N4A46_04035, partial [Schleiferiaceae bacterium]|nr:hypothetical protein [Schleiferiaceae bacterium]